MDVILRARGVYRLKNGWGNNEYKYKLSGRLSVLAGIIALLAWRSAPLSITVMIIGFVLSSIGFKGTKKAGAVGGLVLCVLAAVNNVIMLAGIMLFRGF